MVYELPEPGEPNWGTKVNASLEYLRGKAEAATSVSDNAVSTAVEARNLAQNAAVASDAQVAARIADPDSATAAALSASYAHSRVASGGLYAGDGSVADAAVESLLGTVKSSLRTPINAAPGGAKHATRTIFLDAGDYTITSLQALLGGEGLTSTAEGFRLVGAGSALTNIIFEPDSAGELLFNDYWRNVQISGCTFVAATEGCTFFLTDTSHAAQRYTFIDVSWEGPWKYTFDLKGTNNNSEYLLIGCESYFHAADGAFFHIGDADTSDEFLNYWFLGFKFWSTSAPLLDVAKGGHFHFWGLDVSDWGTALTSRQKIFNLRGTQVKTGTKFLTVEAMRCEIKNALGGVLFSEWSQGEVSINCDMSSQRDVYSYGDVIHISYDAQPGPVYTFRGGSWAGKIRVSYTEASRLVAGHRIKICDGEWRQRRSPSECVEYDPSVDVTSFSAPQVVFERMSTEYTDAASTAGASTWDATVGWAKGDRVMAFPLRQIKAKGYSNSLYEGVATWRVNLPVGAMITGLRVVFPGLRSSSTAQPTWAVVTKDSQTILSQQVSRRQRDGYNELLALDAPWLCGNSDEATLTIEATGITTTDTVPECAVILEGYW